MQLQQNNSKTVPPILRKVKDNDCWIIISAVRFIIDSFDSDEYYTGVRIMDWLYELPSLKNIPIEVLRQLPDSYFVLINISLESYLDTCHVDDFDSCFKVFKLFEQFVNLKKSLSDSSTI